MQSCIPPGAGHSGTSRLDVSCLAIIEEGEQGCCEELLEDARSQRGVNLEVLFVDRTNAGDLQVEGARVVRGTSVSRGHSWRVGAEACEAPFVAWMYPGCRLLPTHLACAKAALKGAGRPNMVACDYYLHDAQGQFIERSHPTKMGSTPGPYWEGGVVMRQETLAGISEEVFHPVELKLWQAQCNLGKVASVEDPGFSVANSTYEAGQDRMRRDGVLLSNASRPFTGRQPALSLSIVSFNQRDALMECLEAACRQELPAGTFEIILTNDGSTDGTKEALESLTWPVPVTIVHQENSGIPAARNAGLRVARGRYVLFFNDDSIAAPNCLERHLDAHTSIVSGEKCVVLGRFEQPREAMGNALRRHLESSADVFPYAALPPQEFIPMQFFHTGNASVELSSVRKIGGMDESFCHDGCEDADLGIRLEKEGLKLYHEPTACVVHEQYVGFESIRSRSLKLAKACVRLFRKHPEWIAKLSGQGLTLKACEGIVTQNAKGIAELESAADELSRIDLGILSQLGGAYTEFAEQTMARLGELLNAVHADWRNQGYAAGFREHGLDGLSELLPAPDDAPRIETQSARRLLAWPRWDDATSLDHLMELAAPVSSDDFAALILLRDEESDIDEGLALSALQAAYTRRFGESPDATLEVVVELVPQDVRSLSKIGRNVNALLPCGGEPEPFLSAIAAERLSTPLGVENWRARFEGSNEHSADLAPEPTAAEELELTVIIPTHDRPRELLQVIEKLCIQDLDPKRFEVIVVDDASQQPAEEVLSGVQTPFSLQVIHQPGGGPGAARNRGIEQAQGALIVFFNDDAVPATDNLRRHLEVHNSRTDRNALIGTFTQLPELVVDSFTRHVETSRVLFAQPLMKSGVVYGGLSFCTGNLSIARDLLLEVNGFDESFPFAGGEDSELGLRLERKLGVRVLYDSSVVCEHDHVLDIHHYLERMKVIGWSASMIEDRHGNTGLVNDRPQDDAGWLSLQAEIQSTAEEALVVVGQIDAICQHERRGGESDVSMEDFGEACNGISGYGFRCGMLAANGGVLPGARGDEAVT